MKLVGALKTDKSFGGLPTRLALSDPIRAAHPAVILKNLPQGSGLIWRAYDARPSRTALQSLNREARRRHVLLFVAQSSKRLTPAFATHEHMPAFKLNHPLTDGKYMKARRVKPQTLITAAAHNEREIIAAARAGVDAVLISPVFTTQSHIGARSLGPLRFAILARRASALGLRVIALGGMVSPSHERRLQGSGAMGLAGISLFKTH